ncbi:MAG: signal peptidase I [Clostridia bacterium]|nr:signal peptidase I [Clostridia bacterium]
MNSKKQSFIIFGVAFLLFALIVVLIFVFVQPMRVVGNSMYPTYKENNIIFVNTTVKDYSTNDVVVLYYGHEKIVKRICAESGDLVEIRNDGIYINGKYITENNANYDEVQYLLEDSEYFVLGDNYAQSIDSRHFGVVEAERIIGKVICNKTKN